MNPLVNTIAGRLSVRPPLRRSLEILDRVMEIATINKDTDPATALSIIQSESEFASVIDFERDFPSLCFALATGVGKTRLMGAFISYLHLAHGINHFFVLAPNLTIYNKLITDFTPNTPKYVFQGIAEFANTPPEIITGDNYESGRGVRGTLIDGGAIHVNVFNISKINSEVRGGKAPKIKRLSEYIGRSYFDYLAGLDDLVLLMDESHRYRATAGLRAINELKPILGLELTATPQTIEGGRAVPFKNVIYSYPLSMAMADGFVKLPFVATRENFNPADYKDRENDLERLKLEDGIAVHEDTKAELEAYARNTGKHRVKPFMLIAAQDTTHAEALKTIIESDEFYEGAYKGKVITVHSQQGAEAQDKAVQSLLAVESPDEPTEIVIHVAMLGEGWDVNNLYTIVPLRAANSRTLVEQSIGRGLRLPYGKRTGVSEVDRLTVIAHEHFQELVDEANRGDSIFKGGLVIGRDGIQAGRRSVTVEPLYAEPAPGKEGADPAQAPSPNEIAEREVARRTHEVIRKRQNLPSSRYLKKAEELASVVREVEAACSTAQSDLPGVAPIVDVAEVAKKTVDRFVELSIDIPKIIVVPRGEVTTGFDDFELDTSGIHYNPVAENILVQSLINSSDRDSIGKAIHDTSVAPEIPLVEALGRLPEISYDEQSEMLFRLVKQMVAHLRSYLPDEAAVRNVVFYFRKALSNEIYRQLMTHYRENAAGYDVKVTQGFTTLKPTTYTVGTDGERDFRETVEERQMIRGMSFKGFSRCLYRVQTFHTDTERRFAVVLEDDPEVLKWLKPGREHFQIEYKDGTPYEPDFVVETITAKYLCETKRRDEMQDPVVLSKAKAAALWCDRATEHELKYGGKPWSYLLIPHDAVQHNSTLSGLAAGHTFVR